MPKFNVDLQIQTTASLILSTGMVVTAKDEDEARAKVEKMATLLAEADDPMDTSNGIVKAMQKEGLPLDEPSSYEDGMYVDTIEVEVGRVSLIGKADD